MDNIALARLLFPNVTASPDEVEGRFPPRDLPEGAKVTRMAPSPTGFMHLGNLFGAMADERLAHQSGGVFYLRIEDTDKKREVEGGVEKILQVFDDYGLPFDEGAARDGDLGAYGPYRQSGRVDIYHVFAKKLVEEGKAYPCFCSEQRLAEIREAQSARKINAGYYGEYAECRLLPLDEAARLAGEGRPWVLRYRSEGDPEKRVRFTDLVKGEIYFPENNMDIVLLKSDGVPTYHFAHVVDDHLMRTTHVVRGEEWLATLPVHVQLFGAMGWRTPKYVHTAHLMKQEGGAKRKLSKRKDPELALDYYKEAGITAAALKEYIMTLLNSNFEDWRKANSALPLEDFPFSIKKMSVSGALFDMDKLLDISKNVISRMQSDEVYGLLVGWAREFDPDFARLLERDPDFSREILAIGRGGPKPRKDIAAWNGAKDYMSFFFDELFKPAADYPESIDAALAARLLRAYLEADVQVSDAAQWFECVKQIAVQNGFAAGAKEYKESPELYNGHAGDVSMVIRLALTGRRNSPDLYEVIRLLGGERVKQRILQAIETLES